MVVVLGLIILRDELGFEQQGPVEVKHETSSLRFVNGIMNVTLLISRSKLVATMMVGLKVYLR